MRVEVINTGTELLLGNVVNTHLRAFAEGLFPLGLRIQRQVTVPDGEAIAEALAESFSRADLVLVTGGLGPTTDDVTRDLTARLLGLDLIHDEEVMRAISARFARRGLVMTERIALQAQYPRGATVLHNAHGTAPGLYLPAAADGSHPHLFLLPGPPRELLPMFHDAVLPMIRKLGAVREDAELRSYRLVGLGESEVEDLVGGPLLELGLEVGYCARPGAVDLRTIGTTKALDGGEAIVRARLGINVFTNDDRSLEKVVVDLLASRQATVATAESCTGGFIAHHLTNVPGASAVFTAGYVTYANSAKVRDLGVDAVVLSNEGAVSAAVAQAMAQGARRTAGTDYGLATTGIAGPGGGTPEKPVGTVFIALAGPAGELQVVKHRFPTDRSAFKQLASQTALDLLRRLLLATARS